MKLQLFSSIIPGQGQQGATIPPAAAGTPAGGGEQQPKTYTEAEVQARIQAEIRKATDASAAKVRKAVEAEYKPKLDEAQNAVNAAKPFLENPTLYMTQFLAQNPGLIQTVANGVDQMMKGGVPTAAQVRTIGQAAASAEDPRVAKRLEELENQMKASREANEEQAALNSALKSFAKDAEAAGLSWDQDDFLAYVNKFADENEIGDDDSIDTRALFRAYKAEKLLDSKGKPKPPKLPGGSGAPAPAGGEKPKTWAEAGDRAAAMLKAARAEE